MGTVSDRREMDSQCRRIHSAMTNVVWSELLGTADYRELSDAVGGRVDRAVYFGIGTSLHTAIHDAVIHDEEAREEL